MFRSGQGCQDFGKRRSYPKETLLKDNSTTVFISSIHNTRCPANAIPMRRWWICSKNSSAS